MLSRFSFHQQRRDKHPHTHPFAHFSTCEFLTLNTAEQDCCKEGAGSSNLTTLPFRKPITHVQSIACGPHTALESYKQGPGKNYKLFFKHHEFCFAFYNSFFKNWIAPVTSMNFTDDNIVLEGQKVSLPWPYTTACVRNQTLAPVGPHCCQPGSCQPLETSTRHWTVARVGTAEITSEHRGPCVFSFTTGYFLLNCLSVSFARVANEIFHLFLNHLWVLFAQLKIKLKFYIVCPFLFINLTF